MSKVDLLPIMKEKYIFFTKHVNDTAEGQDLRTAIKLRFIDSYKLLNASLDKLSSLLAKDKLRILRAEFATLSKKNFDLLTRKDVFPYEYVDSVKRLDEYSLPSRESFISSLSGNTVSETDYAHAETVWQQFSVRTLGEYSDLCVESYGLDPAHYYTLPGFTWDAMLKHTRINFALLTDINMVMFVERGIRGGLSQCSNRYAGANNRYMQSGYDSSKPSSYIVYYDVNNLYGWAMCRPLPYADFEWVDDEVLANLDVDAITADSPTGYILKSAWLRDYIELNTRHRTRATNDFEKNLFKLMNNAVFGKTMENVRNRVDVRLLSRWNGRYGVEAMIAKSNFHSRSVFAEILVAVELRKLEVKFAKPIYAGMFILDISKVCLYEFYHEYIVPTFGNKCSVMYTDTDSLLYSVECDDVYKTMKRDIARFDTSDYPPDNAYGTPLANKKIPDLMKDECNGSIVTEFVGLRAKMYSIRVDGRKDTKKAKGVKSGVVARTITFDDYVRCLENKIAMTRDQSCIRSKLHEVYTMSETKIALSPYDDKRYLVLNSTKTLLWGHYRVPR
ncbi:uncharacterized protein [Cardiocondyla obscurior]|uniref:uncharacterized protein n=1 Tax=Cardiocondyla obscurior TaxID=286306 RepID=UPI0039655E43